MATSEQLAQSRALVEELRHKEEQLKGGVAEVEARELALKGKFDQCAFTSSPLSTFSDGDTVCLLMSFRLEWSLWMLATFGFRRRNISA